MPCFEEEGHQLFDAACRLDLEGIVAKRKADAYAAETAWFKIKNPVYTQAEGRSELFERHPPAHSPHQIDYFCQWPHGHLPYLLALPSPAPLRDSPIRVARICPGEESMPYPPLKILLVEDDAMVRELLARLLESSDYVVEQADNGATALEAARRLDGSLSLVVTDLNMPVMDGLELARTLRRTDRELPILVVTALDPTLVTQAGIKADVLVKPFLPDEFLERVAQLVKPVADHGRPA
jgi:CheY-like chemotaxis protein